MKNFELASSFKEDELMKDSYKIAFSYSINEDHDKRLFFKEKLSWEYIKLKEIDCKGNLKLPPKIDSAGLLLSGSLNSTIDATYGNDYHRFPQCLGQNRGSYI